MHTARTPQRGGTALWCTSCRGDFISPSQCWMVAFISKCLEASTHRRKVLWVPTVMQVAHTSTQKVGLENFHGCLYAIPSRWSSSLYYIGQSHSIGVTNGQSLTRVSFMVGMHVGTRHLGKKKDSSRW